eukprot:TRINITY_DN16234_c0_g2_i1.p1 TRINITY_DN16234_c0_g2~~TRINITY_DN16234_c0_g2_i1.p1  ORF type:complete len:197 (+),score=-14.56 TRINITY_DN16234_c0_g2_i1:70-591(+)
MQQFELNYNNNNYYNKIIIIIINSSLAFSLIFLKKYSVKLESQPIQTNTNKYDISTHLLIKQQLLPKLIKKFYQFPFLFIHPNTNKNPDLIKFENTRLYKHAKLRPLPNQTPTHQDSVCWNMVIYVLSRLKYDQVHKIYSICMHCDEYSINMGCISSCNKSCGLAFPTTNCNL